MLFGNLLGKRIKPRNFVYTPRYYDPEEDKDPRARINFDKSPLRRSVRRRTGSNPWFLLVVVGVVAALIVIIQRGEERTVGFTDVELTPSDAIPVETTVIDSAPSEAAEEEYIETQ